MNNVLPDLRYALRLFLKTPGLTCAAVLALALGIGANTAIFSVVNAVLLRPLPFSAADRLVNVQETARRATVERRAVSYPNFEDWRRETRGFLEIAAVSDDGFTLSAANGSERLNGEMVSSSYFRTLGVEAERGRTFTASEDAPGQSGVVVLSHNLWRRRFEADPAAMGRLLTLNQRPFTVVGIMPARFRGLSDTAEIWVPMAGFADPQVLARRGSRWHGVVARLRPGVSIEQAQAEMSAIARRLEEAYPDVNRNRGAVVIPLREQLFGDLRRALLVLLGAVCCVLLIACANVANLMLARASGRRKELAIRAAVGAERGRLIRQLLTESVVLALLGGTIGILLAIWGIDLLIALNPVTLPEFVRIGIDARVLFFTAAVSLASGVAFGIIPALVASAPDLHDTLKDTSRRTAGDAGGMRLRSLLVVSEVALALMLLVGAGLLMKSLQRIYTLDPGFVPQGALTMRVVVPEGRYAGPKAALFARELVEKLEALPGVERAALGTNVPLDGNSSANVATIEGRELSGPDDEIRVYVHRITPGFFGTLGTPLAAGRDFTTDDSDPTRTGVVVISQTMARRHWPDAVPIGRRLKLRNDLFTIVGVAGDVKYRDLLENPSADPDIYFPLFRTPDLSFSLLLRATSDPSQLASSVHQQVQRLDPEVPVFDVATVTELVSNQTARARFSALLLSIFASAALVLAVVGIYGVMAYSVSQQTHQIGVRMALGAQARDVLQLVVGRGLFVVAAGVGLGLVGAFALTRVLAGLLYGVTTTDPATFVAVAALLGLVAMLACYLPARRATKIDPILALRGE